MVGDEVPPLRGLVPFSAGDLSARCATVLSRIESLRAQAHEREIQSRMAYERTEWVWPKVDVLPRRVAYLPARETVEAEYGKPDEEGRSRHHWTGRWWTDRAWDQRAEPYHELQTAAEAVAEDTRIWVNTRYATELY